MPQYPAFDRGGHTTIKYGCIEGDMVVIAPYPCEMGSAIANCELHAKGCLAEGGVGENEAYATINVKCEGPN